MTAPQCPQQLVMKRLMEDLENGVQDPANTDDLLNALRYLDNMLSNRRAYQRRNQIKRAVILKYAKEHGFDKEIDDAVALRHGSVLESLSLDDDEVDDAD